MFNPNFEVKSKSEPHSFEDFKTLLKETEMLCCPNCGSTKFTVTISTKTTLARAVFADRFGLVSGENRHQESYVEKQVCDKCGAEVLFNDLENVKFCHICGKSLGKIYRRHKANKRLFHLQCALNQYGEDETEVVYKE